MSHEAEPVAVSLHGISVVDARPAASRKVKGDFFHAAPHLAEARTHLPAPTVEERLENVPDFAPTQSPAPKF